MSPTPSAIIWISCRPLIRLAAGVASGFLLTKAGVFPPAAAKGAGQIALKITLPCLLFSKIVPAFTSDNIKSLGPLILVAVLYEIIGVALAWIIKLLFWVPHRFRYGILIAGGWANVGDIPTAVLLSVTANAPFKGTSDQNLVVAYISAFLLVFNLTMFPPGFYRWIAWDFEGPDVEPHVMQKKMKARRQRLLRFLLLKRRTSLLQSDERICPDEESSMTLPGRHSTAEKPTSDIQNDTRDSDTISPSSQIVDSTPEPTLLQTGSDDTTESTASPTAPPKRLISYYASLLYIYARGSISGFFNPIPIAIYVALPISLIPQLKALFIEVPGVHMPPAPDGQPPLAFVQDFADFIGAASVPIGLICIGSSLARLSVPLKEWRKLPIGAILGLTIARTVIMPVFGILICQGIIRVGILFKEDKVLLLVCMFLSCVPTGTVQIYLTQVYSGTGTAEHLAAFLVPQYIVMFISMIAVTAYALQAIF